MADSAILSESSVLIGYPNGLEISRVVPTKKFSFSPYNESFIDQAWTVKMAKFCSFFCVVIDHDFDLVHENAKSNLANI